MHTPPFLSISGPPENEEVDFCSGPPSFHHTLLLLLGCPPRSRRFVLGIGSKESTIGTQGLSLHGHEVSMKMGSNLKREPDLPGQGKPGATKLPRGSALLFCFTKATAEGLSSANKKTRETGHPHIHLQVPCCCVTFRPPVGQLCYCNGACRGWYWRTGGARELCNCLWMCFSTKTYSQGATGESR